MHHRPRQPPRPPRFADLGACKLEPPRPPPPPRFVERGAAWTVDEPPVSARPPRPPPAAKSDVSVAICCGVKPPPSVCAGVGGLRARVGGDCALVDVAVGGGL